MKVDDQNEVQIMGKYDPERSGNTKRKKTKTQKFKHHYDEDYSYDDIKDMFRRKKKLKNKQRISQVRNLEWPGV